MDCDCNRAMFKEVLEAGVEQGKVCDVVRDFLEKASGTVDADRGLTIVRHVHETRSDRHLNAGLSVLHTLMPM